MQMYATIVIYVNKYNIGLVAYTRLQTYQQQSSVLIIFCMFIVYDIFARVKKVWHANKML